MSKAIVGLLLLVLTGFGGLHAQSIDCSQAFTRMEHAICSNPQLEQLDRELSELSEHARSRGVISPQAVRAMRNFLALRCSAADSVDVCLVRETNRVIREFALIDAAVVEIPASFHPKQSLAERLSNLQAEFKRASEHHRLTGSVDALALAAINLLDHYRQETTGPVPTGLRSYEIAALESTVVGGCGDLASRRGWQKVLQSLGRSCDRALKASIND